MKPFLHSAFLIACFAFRFGCATTTPCPVDTKPCPKPAPATCETACLHGKNLGCIWATPTPMGATCVQVCSNAALTVPWNVAALTTATTCTP
jgi:hypothetical protein